MGLGIPHPIIKITLESNPLESRILAGRLAAGCLDSSLRYEAETLNSSVFITGGCSGRGVQWIGVVSYNKLVCNII